MRERFLPLPGKWPPPCTRQSKDLALHRWALQTRSGWVWGQSKDYSSRGHGDPAYPSMGYQASTRTSLVLGAEDQQKKSNMSWEPRENLGSGVLLTPPFPSGGSAPSSGLSLTWTTQATTLVMLSLSFAWPPFLHSLG